MAIAQSRKVAGQPISPQPSLNFANILKSQALNHAGQNELPSIPMKAPIGSFSRKLASGKIMGNSNDWNVMTNKKESNKGAQINEQQEKKDGGSKAGKKVHNHNQKATTIQNKYEALNKVNVQDKETTQQEHRQLEMENSMHTRKEKEQESGNVPTGENKVDRQGDNFADTGQKPDAMIQLDKQRSTGAETTSTYKIEQGVGT
ncbi:hypothetical protein HAX54_049903, partial [Datura stramonium]|nr:hypothetical protein [Datura stramonium]